MNHVVHLPIPNSYKFRNTSVVLHDYSPDHRFEQPLRNYIFLHVIPVQSRKAIKNILVSERIIGIYTI